MTHQQTLRLYRGDDPRRHRAAGSDFDIERVVELIERENVTMLPGPPTLYHSLLEVTDKSRLSTLRAAVTGSSDIPVELIRRVQDELPLRSIMPGYLDDPVATAEAVDADGWWHSGDLATIDDAGRVRIVGRKKDMVIVGGVPKSAADETISESELIEWANRRMAGFKVPRTIEFLDRLPLNATGKVLKDQLR